jgi:uncharacterized Zn finger protein (UPF0148 family)
MFCSGCGKEIHEGSKFCPGCGKAADGTSNAANAASDPAKILKEGDFRRWDKAMDALSKKNDGKLTLFCDRVEWRGKVNDNIKIDGIAKVAVGNPGGDPTLEITDSAGKTIKYFRPRSLLMSLAGAGTSAVSQQLQANNIASAREEIESWRAAIDKLRGRL